MAYRSWSKDEGMGISPEAESGIGARDMMAGYDNGVMCGCG